jgi:hypothetical protein
VEHRGFYRGIIIASNGAANLALADGDVEEDVGALKGPIELG